MCNGVMADDGKKKCVVCGERIDKAAVRCNTCKMYQELRRCSVCRVLIPKEARRCNECQSFQGWRSILPSNQVVLAMLVSLASLMTALIPMAIRFFERGSDTKVRFAYLKQDPRLAASDKLLIVATVRNTGKTPTRVERARIDLRPLGLGIRQLVPVNHPDQDIGGNAKADLLLFADNFPQYDSTSGGPKLTALAAREDLCKVRLSLELDISETNVWGEFEPAIEKSDQIDGRYLIPWIWERIPGEQSRPPC